MLAYACRYHTLVLLSDPAVIGEITPDSRFPTVLKKLDAHPLNQVFDGICELLKNSQTLEGLENHPLLQMIVHLSSAWGTSMRKHPVFELINQPKISNKKGWIECHGMFTAATVVGEQNNIRLRMTEKDRAILWLLEGFVPVKDLRKIILEYYRETAESKQQNYDVCHGLALDK